MSFPEFSQSPEQEAKTTSRSLLLKAIRNFRDCIDRLCPCIKSSSHKKNEKEENFYNGELAGVIERLRSRSMSSFP